MTKEKREEEKPRLDRGAQRRLGDELRKRLPLEEGSPPPSISELLKKLEETTRHAKKPK